MTAQFTRAVAFDTEGYVGVRGRQPGAFVCMTFAMRTAADPERMVTGITTDRKRFVREVVEWLSDEQTIVICHNAPHDLGVLLACVPDALPLVLRAVYEGRVSCTQVREKLITIAHDWTFVDPALGVPPKYSLAQLARKYLGVDISGSKEKFTDPGRWSTFSGDPDPGRTVWRVNYHQLHGVPLEQWPESATNYATEDAELTLLVHEAQSQVEPTDAGPLVQEDGIWIVDEIPQMRAALALHLAAMWGFRTDPEAVEKTLREWQRIRSEGFALGYELGFVRGDDGVLKGEHARPRLKADREAYCESHGLPFPYDGWAKKGKPWSVSRTAQQDAIAVAYEASGREVPRNDPTPRMVAKWVEAGNPADTCLGSIKYDADTLAASKHEGLKSFGEATTYMNYFVKYADTLRTGTTRPITSRPDVLKRTGRTGWSNPPLQGPPKKGGYRECHVPRPGYVYVSIDYDSIEMGGLSQTLLDFGLGSTMADAINDGRDLNTMFGAYIAGIPYDVAMQWKKTGAPEWEGFNEGPRFRAKAANYGFGGGMGPETFLATQLAQGADLSLFAPVTGTEAEGIESAAKLKADWCEFWPEMRGYFALMSHWTELGSFTAVQPVSGRLRGGTGYCDGCNTFFQGRVADGAKAAFAEVVMRSYGGRTAAWVSRPGSSPNAARDALWTLARPEYAGTPDDPLYGCRPVLMLHDEIIAEVPEHKLTAAADEMARVMRDVMQLYTPDVRVGAEPAAMRRWYKKADTVRQCWTCGTTHNGIECPQCGADRGKLLPWEPSE